MTIIEILFLIPLILLLTLILMALICMIGVIIYYFGEYIINKVIRKIETYKPDSKCCAAFIKKENKQ